MTLTISKKEPVSIKDPWAIQVFNFPFKVGDQLQIRSKREVGIVENAIAEPRTGHHFKVTYYLQTPDGRSITAGLSDLKRAF